MEVTRELYNSMAEGDVDVQLDAMDRVLAKRDADAKKNDLKNSTEKIKPETKAADSQMKAGWLRHPHHQRRLWE